MSIGDEVRAKLAAMTPEEKDAALKRLLQFLAPTDGEIAAEIESMSDAEIEAEMRAEGVDPAKWAEEMRAKMKRWCAEARERKL